MYERREGEGKLHNVQVNLKVQNPFVVFIEKLRPRLVHKIINRQLQAIKSISVRWKSFQMPFTLIDNKVIAEQKLEWIFPISRSRDVFKDNFVIEKLARLYKLKIFLFISKFWPCIRLVSSRSTAISSGPKRKIMFKAASLCWLWFVLIFCPATSSFWSKSKHQILRLSSFHARISSRCHRNQLLASYKLR